MTLWRYETGAARVPDDVLIRASQLLRTAEVLAAHPVVQAWLGSGGPQAA